MRLATAPRQRQSSRIADATIANALAIGSIVDVAERAGVAWDARKTRPSRGEYWACCPFHAEKSASFHVVDRGADSFFKCFGCGERGDAIALARKLHRVGFRDAVRIVGGELEVEPDPALMEAREQRRRELEAERQREQFMRRASAQAIYYAAGVHAAGTLGELYLRKARAIRAALGAAELRFHPRAPLSPYAPEKAGRCPAIVAAIRNSAGEHIGAHCTFIRKDGAGKADLPHLRGSRMVVGEHVGGFIRLGRVVDAAVIGEGIETALSASDACGLPALAAINAANMAAVVLPERVKRVVIAHDRDAKGAGELAANALAERLWASGVGVELLPPPEGFKDWNDAAQAGAFPRRES